MEGVAIMVKLFDKLFHTDKDRKDGQVKRFSEKQQKEEAFDKRNLGVRPVALDKIIGSVGRYQDFDRRFRLKRNRPSARLEKVVEAFRQGKTMPPIILYQIKNEFYVLDGNHRVSAANQLGYEFIDAQITEFLPSKNTLENIIYREKTDFLSRTELPETIDLTEVGQYRYLLKQIDSHHRFLMQADPNETIAYKRAAQDWYKTVYRPLTAIIKNSRLRYSFPKRTQADLYAYISHHQWERGRKRKYGIGIDQLIPKNMEEFRSKMVDLKEFELPEMKHWISAFVLVAVKVGSEYRVMDKLFAFREVQEVHFVHGDFDLVTKIVMKRELLSSDAEIFGHFVHEKIRQVAEVTKTQTLIPISSREKPPQFLRP
jgi:hypothetical protein